VDESIYTVFPAFHWEGGMSVRVTDKELGEALYRYIVGELDALPAEMRDRGRLAGALVYVQRTYGLSPQQVVERLRGRRIAVARGAPSISGRALERLLEVLGTLYERYDVPEPELRLQEHGVRVVGVSKGRDVALSTMVPLKEGEGYVAPSRELPVFIDMFRVPEGSSVKSIVMRDGRLYAVTSSGEEVYVGGVSDPGKTIDIDGLDEKMEAGENRAEVAVRPEVFRALRRLMAECDVEPQIFIVKERGKPAIYIGDKPSSYHNRFIVRVPDAMITRAYVDPRAPDGSLAYFSGSIAKNRLPDPVEEATVTTKVFPEGSKKAFPMRIEARQRDGLWYYVYYAPGDPEEMSFSPPEEPLVSYHVGDDGAAYALADLDMRAGSIYVLPERGKVSFAGTSYDSDISYLVVVDAPARAVDEAMLGKILALSDSYARFGDFIPSAFKVMKALGAEPSISIGAREVSLFGAHQRYNEVDSSTGEAKTIREKIAWLTGLPGSSACVTLSGKDLLEVLQRFNELRKSGPYYGGRDELRVVVKPSGEAEVEASSVHGDEKRVVWRKVLRATNPPSAPVELRLELFDVAYGKLPFVEVKPRGIYRVNAPASLLKNAAVDLLVHPDKGTVSTRTRIGNTTVFMR
jgi:hypothetical protein